MKTNVSYIQVKSYSAQATTYVYNSNTRIQTVCTTQYLRIIISLFFLYKGQKKNVLFKTAVTVKPPVINRHCTLIHINPCRQLVKIRLCFWYKISPIFKNSQFLLTKLHRSVWTETTQAAETLKFLMEGRSLIQQSWRTRLFTQDINFKRLC